MTSRLFTNGRRATVVLAATTGIDLDRLVVHERSVWPLSTPALSPCV